MLTRILATLGLAAFVTACGSGEQSGADSGEQTPVAGRAAAVAHPVADAATVRRGRDLYLRHCAQCHGENAQGAPDWQKPGPDGKYPAPPLNGTGHAWHHPMDQLRQTIAHGTRRLGGSMPAWKDELTAEQIDAIIYWFQAQWPEELYQAWEEMSQRARKGG